MNWGTAGLAEPSAPPSNRPTRFLWEQMETEPTPPAGLGWEQTPGCVLALPRTAREAWAWALIFLSFPSCRRRMLMSVLTCRVQGGPCQGGHCCPQPVEAGHVCRGPRDPFPSPPPGPGVPTNCSGSLSWIETTDAGPPRCRGSGKGRDDPASAHRGRCSSPSCQPGSVTPHPRRSPCQNTSRRPACWL